jgi:hypothetical protein
MRLNCAMLLFCRTFNLILCTPQHFSISPQKSITR